MSREYYAYWYRLDDRDSYLIWYSNETDGFIIDDEGFIPSFTKVKDLQIFAKKKNLTVDVEKPNLITLDPVKNWLKNGGEIEDYNSFLNTWNLFEDISVSTNGNFDKEKEITNGIYNRIFWGCNIPAVTPEGKCFTPTWTKKELKIIHKTYNFGFQIFEEKIKLL